MFLDVAESIVTYSVLVCVLRERACVCARMCVCVYLSSFESLVLCQLVIATPRLTAFNSLTIFVRTSCRLAILTAAKREKFAENKKSTSKERLPMLPFKV